MKVVHLSRPGLRIGLLGSGQLARMLALRAHSLGHTPVVYGGSPTDPAAQVTHQHVAGDLNDIGQLESFLKSVDIATFESEFLNADLLKTLSEKTGTPLYPEPLSIALFQDRLSQKQLLLSAKLPTSDYLAVSTFEDLETAFERFNKTGLVLKKRRFGYDGYGTFIVKSKKDLAGLKTLLEKEAYGFIAERFVPFKRELALSAVRNHRGQVIFLPLVETFQKESRCFWVKGPVKHKKRADLQKKISKLLRSLNYVGIVAFELFEVGSELLINETAPRVHNSAHYSLNALSKDQFQLHLEAILDFELHPPQLISKGFAMVNLLGSSGDAPYLGQVVHSQLHWYGKIDNRPGRKMGHLNVLATNPEEALKLGLKDLKKIKL